MGRERAIRGVVDAGNAGAAQILDGSKGNVWNVTLTQNVTLGVSNLRPGHSLTVIVTGAGFSVLGWTAGTQTVAIPPNVNSSTNATGITVFTLQGSTLNQSAVTLIGSTSSSSGSVAASQATWFISFSTGNDTNSGLTSGTALKTLDEFYRRTVGVVLTTSVTVNVLDLDAATPPTLKIGYAVVPRGFVVLIQGTPVTVIATTVGAFRAEATGTNTARAITQAAVTWPATPGAQRIRFTDPGNSNATCFPVKNEGGGVGRISAPTVLATNAVVTPAPGDHFTVYTTPVIRDVQFLGILDGDETITASIIVKDFEVSAGGDPVFTSLAWSGGGIFEFYGCGIGVYQATGEANFVACRLDNYTLPYGISVLLSCVANGVFQCLGGEGFFRNIYAAGTPCVVAGGGVVSLLGPYACFDVASFSLVDGIFDVESGGTVDDTGQAVYGTNNAYSMVITEGGYVAYSAQWPATTTRGDAFIDTNVRNWAALPYVDALTGSRVVVRTGSTVNGNVGGGTSGKTQYGQVTADQAALNSNVFVDIPGVTITTTSVGSTAWDIQFQVSGTVSGAASAVGVLFQVLVNGVVPLGGTCLVQGSVGATAVSTSCRIRATYTGQNIVVRAQYKAAAGVSFAIRPNTTSESCSLAAVPGVP